MKLTMKYKGRSFSSGRALANAMRRDFDRQIEHNIRSAASSSGARVKKTHKGFEIAGEVGKLNRFRRRLGQ